MCVLILAWEKALSSPHTKGRNIQFSTSANIRKGMASVPQSMLMAKSRRKKIEKEIYEQANVQPSKYSTKMMNSIWGQYNRYSVHNLKSVQGEEGSKTDSPVVQILQEHCDQVERACSPVVLLLKEQHRSIERSRSPLRRVLLEHQYERSRSPSISDVSDDERCNSPLAQLVNDHHEQMMHSLSPLLNLAAEHQGIERSNSPFKEYVSEVREQQDRCSSPFQMLFQDGPSHAATGFLSN